MKEKKTKAKSNKGRKTADLNERRRKNLLKLMAEESYVPMKEKELAILLQVKKKDREDLKKLLTDLAEEGRVWVSKRGKYSLPKDENGDTVKDEETGIIVGTYDRAGMHYGFVIPDKSRMSRDIFIPGERSMGASTGQKVVVELTDPGSRYKSPEGRITEILGYESDPGVDIVSIIKGYDIPLEFPEKVMKQAGKVPAEVREEDTYGRRDLRALKMVTIDSEEAKDLDDAVSLYKEGENYVLGVHIADVSHYVREDSALDKEALKRGTSVYLVDRVIPMLPPRLSNGICSLNPREDRLTLSCIMIFDPAGTLLDHEIVESVIRTDERMTYTAVNGIIEDGDEGLMKEYKDLVPMFMLMKELAEILRERRRRRGSVDFDLPETKIVLDEDGRPIEVGPYDRNSATRLIEDFMLAANETVAEHFCKREIPFVYRIHEDPDPDKIRKLETFIKNFGYGIKVRNDEVRPVELQKLLEKIAGSPEESLISTLTLRSMQRAVYSTECKGHFGLACRYYCHFTSPIRRYPDLIIHRIIKESIHGNLKGKRIEHYDKILPDVARRSSSRERLADEAERETDKLKKAEYMADHLGEAYRGVISGVTNWGIYVELPNTVEGLVHISKIDSDYYYFNEDACELVGERTGRRFVLGQSVSVRVSGVDLGIRAVDFELDE
ncbi:MAG: ribonuclease R [Lachnospiraceae bacterium]|nr:ribonuclease R [Lachnospiraceae bacterium]